MRRRRYYDPGKNPYPRGRSREATPNMKHKTPTTDSDLRAIEAAEEKRRRKAARRLSQ